MTLIDGIDLITYVVTDQDEAIKFMSTHWV